MKGTTDKEQQAYQELLKAERKKTARQKLELHCPEGTPIERAFDTRFKQICPDLPVPLKQYPFDSQRGWKFDRCWPEGTSKRIVASWGGVAVELDGKEHLNLDRFRRDIEKFNAAIAAGWTVFHCTYQMLEEDPYPFFEMLRRALTR